MWFWCHLFISSHYVNLNMLIKIIHDKRPPHKQLITNAGTCVEKEKPSLSASKGANCYGHNNQEGGYAKPKTLELEQWLSSYECTLLWRSVPFLFQKPCQVAHNSSMGLNTLFWPLQVLAWSTTLKGKTDFPNDQHLRKGQRSFFLLLLTVNYHTLASICR